MDKKQFLVTFDFILGVFILFIICSFELSTSIFILFAFIAIVILAVHGYLLVTKFQQKKNNVLYLNGVIIGAMLFLNPVVGSLIGSLNLIILSIIMYFRL